MSLDAEINAYFVKTRSEDDNEDFKTAAAMLPSHVNEHSIRHIKASEGFPLIASGKLTKRDVFIFDHFEGDFFKQLQMTKSLIIGPRCLLICLLRNEQIPLGTSPVYTTAMRDLKISASGVSAEEKERLSTKIQWMGGHYLKDFGRNVTHLISNTIKSNKYEYATMNGIPVMHVDWVQRAWERSLKDYISATDEEFDKYRLPIFFEINITTTGLDPEKKNEIMRIVQENGGTYHRAFRSQYVDVVITEKGKTDSEKYIAAKRCKKDILTAEWIFDSLQKGFALPTTNYQVKSLKVSTPTKSNQSIADFTNSDLTQLSTISRISSVADHKRGADISVNDTVFSTMNESHNDEMTFVPPEPLGNPKNSSHNLQRDVLKKKIDGTAQYRTILEEISQREAKKAGAFLDGCCIYLSGFRTVEKEKLNRILNAGGATRFDAINDEVTHIIVGQLNDDDFRAWKRNGLLSTVHIVRLEWLSQSIKQKQAANENVYRVSLPKTREPDAPSPSSKKTLRSMNQSFKQPEAPPKKKLFDTSPAEKTIENMTMSNDFSNIPDPRASSTEIAMEEDEHKLLSQYSQENMAAQMPAALPQIPVKALADATTLTTPAENSEMTGFSVDYENLNFFQSLLIYVHNNFQDEFYSQLQRECEAARGTVVGDNFQDSVDYAIVSCDCTFDISELPLKAKQVVTVLYVESCLKENKLVTIKYYHMPIPRTADSQPLKGMIIVISSYSDIERDYLTTLAQLLGAKVNNNYVKKEQPLLVCPNPEGAKYFGALKWHYPAVNSAWLVKCAEEGTKVSKRPYLVGDSVEDFPTPTLNTPNRNNSIQTGTPASVQHVAPLRNKRVSELAIPPSTPVNNNMTSKTISISPHTPTNPDNCAGYSIEFMQNILADIEDPSDRECVRRIIEDIQANPTPDIERIKRQVCTPINRRTSFAPKVISDFYNTPEFKRRVIEEIDKRFRIPTKKLKPSTPIETIRKRVLRETCKNLGIAVSDDDENENPLSTSNQSTPKPTTPSIERTTTKRLATASGGISATETPIVQRASSRVEPRSIFGAQTPSRENNSFVPNTQDEMRRKSDISPSSGDRRSLLGKSTIDFDKISFDETEIDAEARRASVSSCSIAKNSPELKQITDFLKERESRRESLRKQQNIDDMEINTAPLQPFESEQLCLDSEGMVDWRDPTEFNQDRFKKKARSMQHQGIPKFSISCADETKLQDVVSKIHNLGGEVCEDLIRFDPSCTHYLCESPNRGEKILGCMASGKWVLSLRYIEESFAKDNFIDEEFYEWGNTKAINIPEISDDQQAIALAAHRWRKELNQGNMENAGIFSGIKAILRINEKLLESLSNVVRAGNGQTIAAKSPYRKSPDAHLATHCFVDIKKMPLSRDDYDYLKEKGVKIASFLYIQAFLLNGANIDFSAYEIKM